MNLSQILFRLNVISGDYKKISAFNEKHDHPVIRGLYRLGLIPMDLFVGYPRMKSYIRTMACDNDPNKRPIRLAAVIIAKNESEYIAEWMAYHKLIGVEKVYLYDNDSDDNMHEVLQPFIDEGFVIYHQIHGNKMQGIAYTDALHRYGRLCKYMAFIDGDEMIAPVKQEDKVIDVLDEFFKNHPTAGGYAINWAMFGSSHYDEKPKGLMSECFIWRAEIGKPGTQMIKTILRPECAIMWHHPHYAIYRMGWFAQNYQGKIVEQNENNLEKYEGLQINHYFTKSNAQWIKRRAMGQCMTGIDKPRPMDDFYRHDHNDVLDDSASYLSEKIKELLKVYTNDGIKDKATCMA